MARQLKEKLYARNPFHAQRLIIENVAVCPVGSSPMPFYTVTAREHEPRLPSWTDQFGAFNLSYVQKVLRQLRGHMLQELRANWSWDALNASIRTDYVPCCTMADTLARYRLPPPAVVLIDIEGIDCELITKIDTCKVRPWLLTYEHTHCPATHRVAAQARMACDCEAWSSSQQRYAGPFRSYTDTHYWLTSNVTLSSRANPTPRDRMHLDRMQPCASHDRLSEK